MLQLAFKHVTLVFALVLLISYSTVNAQAINSNSFPVIRNGNFTAVDFKGVIVGNVKGHVGIDVGLYGVGPYTAQSPYVPCHFPTDPSKNGCAEPWNPVYYYKVESFNTATWFSTFPYGIFVDNVNNNVTHNFGRKVGYVGLEIYPHFSTAAGSIYKPRQNTYGAVRMSFYSFPISANGGYYTNNIGHLTDLPSTNGYYSNPRTSGYINGYLYAGTSGGTPAPYNSVDIAYFGESALRSTTNGQPYVAFSSISNGGTNWSQQETYWYYTSGPLYVGRYLVYIDKYQVDAVGNRQGPPIRKVRIRLDISQPGEYLTLYMDHPAKCFGWSNPYIAPAYPGELNACVSDSNYP